MLNSTFGEFSNTDFPLKRKTLNHSIPLPPPPHPTAPPTSRVITGRLLLPFACSGGVLISHSSGLYFIRALASAGKETFAAGELKLVQGSLNS